MADHHGNLAEIEEGRSLLPAIVKKEQELQERLKAAEADAEKLVRDAKDAAAEAAESAKAGFPEAEAKFLEGELKKYEGSLEDLGKTERARLDDLRKRGEKNVAAAAKAIVGLVLDA